MASNPTKTIDCGDDMGKKLNDLKCVLIQKAVYAKLYKGHKPNEWEPWKTPGNANYCLAPEYRFPAQIRPRVGFAARRSS